MNIKNIFSRSSIPSIKECINAVKSFPKQRKIIFLCVLCLLFVSGISLFAQVAIQPFQEEIAVFGGIHQEGVIGTPRFVNPVLSFTQTDKDLESLVFAGLTKKNIDGSITLDIAEDFSVSSNNLVYTFTIRDDARFQDGTPITASDVVFTIQTIQNPEIKSPKQVFWEGVQVQEIDSQTVRFTLKQPFISFLENTSIGILPLHIWKDVSSEEFPFSKFNTEPIGSGKYEIISVKKNKDSIEMYILESSKYYNGEKPFIKNIEFYFFDDEQKAIRALRRGSIDALSGISPQSVDELPKKTTIYTATLHRMFGLFYNQKETSPIQEKSVRQAIDIGINRKHIIDDALQGFGEPIKSPVPTTIQTDNEYKNILESDLQEASRLLTNAGWIPGENGIRFKNNKPLQITITTASIPELEIAAYNIQEQLQQLGIEVLIETLSINDLNQNVIRSRNFEVLLFGNMLNQETDIFAFWHSSQTSDPGLNIASYKNETVDNLLEQIIQTFDTNQRIQMYSRFETEFFKDIPATFIYSPELIYAVRGNVQDVVLSPITNSSERLLNIENWYTETNFVFPTKD